jgi:Fe-S-cluster-containing dehydrogenase component
MKKTNKLKPTSIVIDTELCTACRACELACHFHHSGRFGTSRSSIQIQFNADVGDVTILFDATCDACLGEIGPLCVHFCTPGALSV